jgi:hypothetical protein
MALLLFRRVVMHQCVKNVTPPPSDQMPFEYESARPDPHRDDDDPSEVPDDNDASVPEEAGYGYGV